MTNPLLLSDRAPHIWTSPFFFFDVPDFLPADVYAEALASFPGEEWFTQQIEGNKRRLSTRETLPQVDALAWQYPVWRKVFAWMSSYAFLDDLYALVHDGLVESRGRFGARPWLFDGKQGWCDELWRARTTTEFEFSRLEPGAFVPLHSDSIYKLVSALLYFPTPDWRAEYGGDTLYLRPKDGGTVSNWRNERLDRDGFKVFHANLFEPNRLAVFVKSAHSHHCVDPIACPPGMARNSLNLNVYWAPGRVDGLVTRARMWRTR